MPALGTLKAAGRRFYFMVDGTTLKLEGLSHESAYLERIRGPKQDAGIGADGL